MSDDTPRTRRRQPEDADAAAGTVHSGARQHEASEGSAEPAPSLAQEFEPGVDPAHARDSRAAGPDASEGDPGSPEDRPEGRADGVARKTGSWAGVLVGGIVGLIAVVLFAIAVPVAPAVAWIGIALEVALFAVLAVSAGMLREGRYRRLSITVLTAGMIAVALIFAVLLLVIGLAR